MTNDGNRKTALLRLAELIYTEYQGFRVSDIRYAAKARLLTEGYNLEEVREALKELL